MRKLFLGQFKSWTHFAEFFDQDGVWELQNGDEEEEFGEGNHTVTIHISHLQNLGLEFVEVFFRALQLSVVVWCKGFEEVRVRHD